MQDLTPKFLLILICILFTGCPRYLVSEKFDIDHSLIKSFNGRQSIQVLVPQNAETKYLIEIFPRPSPFVDFYMDLNDLYINAKELIEDVLVKQNVALSNHSKKYIKFTISKIECESKHGGWITFAYLEFDIETADGYHKHYTVQDKSPSLERAIGGTITHAVEEIFQDKKIISYIEDDLFLPTMQNEGHDI